MRSISRSWAPISIQSVPESARLGNFGKRALMQLPADVIDKYFVPVDDDRWQIAEDIRDSVQFAPTNLINAAETVAFGRFDVNILP